LLLETDFYKVLTNKIGKYFDEGFAINKSAILSISGKRTVLLLLVDGIEITISNYKLEKILRLRILSKKITFDYFFIERKKIYLKNKSDIVYEIQEAIWHISNRKKMLSGFWKL
jgi:hypothetical protein